jgi:hypothetical protein
MSEDKIAGFVVLSVILGVGSGVIGYHFSASEALGWGVGMVTGVVGLLTMIFLAKVIETVEAFIYEEPEESEDDD